MSGDADRDSLPDVLEQQLLERFMPRFQVAVDDCDLAPAEFGMGESEPMLVARNGSVYGQVFRVEGGIELHFYHLWATDCGRVRHTLDAEHVAGLLRSGEDRSYGFRGGNMHRFRLRPLAVRVVGPTVATGRKRCKCGS